MSLDLQRGVHQEPSNVHSKAVAWVAFAFLVITVISIWVAQALIHEEPGSLPTPGPTVQNVHTGPIVRQGRGMDKIRNAERRLRRAGWVDRAQGIAHIPIEDAKRIWVAERNRSQEDESQEEMP